MRYGDAKNEALMKMKRINCKAVGCVVDCQKIACSWPIAEEEKSGKCTF